LLVVYSTRGAHLDQAQIGLLSTDGKLRPVTRDTSRYATLTLSADSRTAATVQVKTTRSLELVAAANSSQPATPRAVAQVADPRQVEWTPDGKLLVSDGEKITRLDGDGQNATVLLGDTNAGLFNLAACGNQYIVFTWAYHAGKTINIWRANADGSALKQLSSGPFESNPMCSPDGKWVYYIDRPGLSRLLRVPIDGGQAEPVSGTDIPNRFGMAGISYFAPDGKSFGLVAHMIDPRTNDAYSKLAIATLDGGAATAPRLLDLDPRLGGGDDFGPMVKLVPHAAPAVTYRITENGQDNLWMQPLDGSPGHQITHFTSEQILDHSWSPDGKTLAITRSKNVADVILLKEGNP
jgi:dipeptidyl aminopeptidase/acylaminoacyl peptidase